MSIQAVELVTAKEKYPLLRFALPTEPYSYQLNAYHSTLVDNWESIQRVGLKPGMSEASGQDWDSHWKGKAIYYHLAFPEHEMDNAASAGQLDSMVIECMLRGPAGYFVPDEDVSTNVNDTPKVIKRKEAIAYGYIVPSRDFVAVHLPDVPDAREWAAQNVKKSIPVKFHKL